MGTYNYILRIKDFPFELFNKLLINVRAFQRISERSFANNQVTNRDIQSPKYHRISEILEMVDPGTPYMLGSIVREHAYVCDERCRERPGTVHRPATVRRAWASSCKSLGHPLSLVRLFPLLRYTVYRTLVPREHQLRDRTSRMHVTAIRRDFSQPRILICRANSCHFWSPIGGDLLSPI